MISQYFADSAALLIELAKVFDRSVNFMLGVDMVGNRRLAPI